MVRLRLSWQVWLAMVAGTFIGVGIAIAGPICDPGTGTCSVASPMDQATPQPTNGGIPAYPTATPTIGLPPTQSGEVYPPTPVEAPESYPVQTPDTAPQPNCNSTAGGANAGNQNCPQGGQGAQPTATLNPVGEDPPIPRPGESCELNDAGNWECKMVATPVNQGNADQPADPAQPAQPAEPAQPTTSDSQGDVATDANPEEANPADTSDGALASEEAAAKKAYNNAKETERLAWDDWRKKKARADSLCANPSDQTEREACSDARRAQYDAENIGNGATATAEDRLEDWTRATRRVSAWKSVQNTATDYRNSCSRGQILADQGLIGICRGKLGFVRATLGAYRAI